MDSTPRTPAGVDAAAYSRMLHRFEKPHWLYTPSVVRVAKAALAVFAAAFAARTLYLVFSGVSILTPLTAISALLLVVSYVACRYLRVCTDDVAAKRQAALDYIKTCPDEISNIALRLEWSPGLTHSEVAEVLFNRYDLRKFITMNGLEALKYIPPHCDILSKLDQFVDNERACCRNVDANYFETYISYISVCRPDLQYADLQKRVQNRFAHPLPPSLASAPAPVAVAVATAASAAPSSHPPSSLSAQSILERDPAATRQAALDHIQQYPESREGIYEHLRWHPGLTYNEVAERVANYEARRSRDFTEFCSRNGAEATLYITDEISLRKLFDNFLDSLEQAYISPGYLQYEAAIPHFMRSKLRDEFRPKWDEKLNKVKARAKDKFLQALRNPGIYNINFGGALAAARDPGVRLGVNYEEVLQNVAGAEFDNYDLSEFQARNGLAALRYLPEDSDIVAWLEKFMQNERAKGHNLTKAELKKLVDDIGAVQRNWRPDLAVFLREFKESPAASSTSVSSATAAAATGASVASSSSLSARQIADSDQICTTPEGQPCSGINRQALEEDVESICAAAAQRKQ